MSPYNRSGFDDWRQPRGRSDSYKKRPPKKGKRDLKPLDERGWSTTNMLNAEYLVRMGFPRRQSCLWNPTESAYLLAAYEWGASIEELMADHERSRGGIETRLKLMMPGYRAEKSARPLNPTQHAKGKNESTDPSRKEVSSSLGRSAGVPNSSVHP